MIPLLNKIKKAIQNLAYRYSVDVSDHRHRSEFIDTQIGEAFKDLNCGYNEFALYNLVVHDSDQVHDVFTDYTLEDLKTQLIESKYIDSIEERLIAQIENEDKEYENLCERVLEKHILEIIDSIHHDGDSDFGLTLKKYF